MAIKVLKKTFAPNNSVFDNHSENEGVRVEMKELKRMFCQRHEKVRKMKAA